MLRALTLDCYRVATINWNKLDAQDDYLVMEHVGFCLAIRMKKGLN